MIRRKQLKEGMLVDILVNNKKVRGYIKQIIPPRQTNQEIEVELRSGAVGIINNLVTRNELKQESFKFYNLFFHERHLLTIWNKYTKDTYKIQSKNPKTKQCESTVFIFSNEELANKILRKLKDDDLAIRRISKQKLITENFINENVTHFRLDEQRRIGVKKLNALEEYYSKF